MRIEFDPSKDAINKEKHGLSLSLASKIDLNTAVINQDHRQDYGENRYIAAGSIYGRMHIMVFTLRDGVLRPISLRKANNREVKRHET